MSSGRRTGGAAAAAAPPTSGGGKIQNVKLVLLGDQGVGKSSIALRFVRGEYTENSEATIGGEFISLLVS